MRPITAGKKTSALQTVEGVLQIQKQAISTSTGPTLKEMGKDTVFGHASRKTRPSTPHL